MTFIDRQAVPVGTQVFYAGKSQLLRYTEGVVEGHSGADGYPLRLKVRVTNGDVWTLPAGDWIMGNEKVREEKQIELAERQVELLEKILKQSKKTNRLLDEGFIVECEAESEEGMKIEIFGVEDTGATTFEGSRTGRPSQQIILVEEIRIGDVVSTVEVSAVRHYRDVKGTPYVEYLLGTRTARYAYGTQVRIENRQMRELTERLNNL